MPALSKAQRRLMAIAAHHPEQVSAKNRGVLNLSLDQLAHYARTPEKRLHKHVKKGKKR